MFRAFIIDDNKYAVEATYHAFSWEELGVDRIDKIYSTNGLVDRILTDKPHIVFIDIEMHDVSGLDIVDACKERGSTSLFVIITGHDNFEYAHAAVNLGVIYYLLKPIDAKDVAILIKKLKKSLLTFEANDISVHLSSKDSLNSYLFARLGDEKYRFLICNLTDAQKSELESVIGKSIIDTYKIGKSKYLFIISNSGISSKIINNLDTYAKKHQIVLSLSADFDKFCSMHSHFNSTNLLSYHSFLHQSGCLLIEPLISADTSILKDVLDGLFKAIDTKYIKGIENALNSLPALFAKQGYTMSHVVWFYNALIGRINIAYSHNHAFPFSQMDEEEIHTNFQNFANLCSTLLTTIKEMIAPDINSSENTNELWKKILDYIEKNYTKKIQAKDICSTLYISQRTLYNVSKANTGETFFEYLTHFRIEKAKHLLLTTPMSLPDIADKIGLKDHYYFNKVFKKHTGVTPYKYKSEGGDL